MHIDELLYCDDEQFVWNCYNAILGRDPDPTGFVHHVKVLRKGRPRAMVIRSLLRSSEGRPRGVRVRGLTFAILVARLMKYSGLRRVLRNASLARDAREAGQIMLSLESQVSQLIRLAAEHNERMVPPEPAPVRIEPAVEQKPDAMLSPRGQQLLDDLIRPGRSG